MPWRLFLSDEVHIDDERRSTDANGDDRRPYDKITGDSHGCSSLMQRIAILGLRGGRGEAGAFRLDGVEANAAVPSVNVPPLEN